MKTLKIISLCLVLAGTTMIGCKKKKDDEVVKDSYKQATPKKEYEKKWEITTSTSMRTTATTNLIAIEFMLNTYILYFSDGEIKTGTYTQTNSNTLVLTDYGTLTINSISGSSFGFSLVTNAESLTITSAAATAPINESANTTAVCNTWKVVSMTSSAFGNIMEPGQELYVTFSKYGTYLTKDTYSMGDSTFTEYGTNTWLWSNSVEDRFCYGEWDGSNISDCSGLNTVSVAFREEYSKCTFVETHEDSLGTESFTYELVVQ